MTPVPMQTDPSITIRKLAKTLAGLKRNLRKLQDRYTSVEQPSDELIRLLNTIGSQIQDTHKELEMIRLLEKHNHHD